MRQEPGSGHEQRHEPGAFASIPHHRSSYPQQQQLARQQKLFQQTQPRSFSASSMYPSRRASRRSSSAAAAIITSSAAAASPSSDSPKSQPLPPPSQVPGWSMPSTAAASGLVVQPIPLTPLANSSHYAQQQQQQSRAHARRRSRSHSRSELGGGAPSAGGRRGARPRASSLQPSAARSVKASSFHHHHSVRRVPSSPALLFAPSSRGAPGSSHPAESPNGQAQSSAASMIISPSGGNGTGYHNHAGGIAPVAASSAPSGAAGPTHQLTNYPASHVQHVDVLRGTIRHGDLLDETVSGGEGGCSHPHHGARGSGGPGSAHSAPTEASSTSRGARYSLTPRASDRGGVGVMSLATKRGGGAQAHHPAFSSRHRSDEEAMHAKTCRRVMEDLNRTQRSERRIAALTHVCECCDHKDEGKHNIELSLGMLGVLAKCLHHSVYDDEVRMICAALEMVLRASPRDVQVAYLKLNASQHNHLTSPPHQQQHSLLANLFRILERCESNALKHSEVSILNITKVVFYLSRCPELRTTLCRQPAVLDSLERVDRSIHGSVIANGVTDANTFFQHVNQAAEVRFYRMRTLANLANVEDNKVLLLEHQDGALLESILRVSHWDSDDSCRQYAASSLMDLASAPSNQVTMAHNEKVLGTLVKMALVEKVAVTREFVVTALQNLAFCKENRVRLVEFKDGVLLEALKQALSGDLDAKARRRAAGALTNLVCDETAERMGRHKGLLDTLAIVATKDDNWDVQTRAALALTKIANCITIHMDCHDALLDALVVASLSKASNSVSAVLRVKARNPENRVGMARHPGIIDTLTDLCLSVGAAKANDRDNAIRALMHLVNENRNRKILCTKNVLEALVAGASYTDPDLEEARDSAVRALERLGTDPTNRDAMARHPGLITAVAKAVEREAGWQESGREAPENGYLAKPLLMSLLVAM